MTNTSTEGYSSDRDRIQKMNESEARKMNEMQGGLTGYDCPKCKNRGFTSEVRGMYVVTVECDCMVYRRNITRLKNSGLQDVVNRYTFENYKASEPWQKATKETAFRFAENAKGWFYIGGQIGSGKTHICTAITGSLIRQSKDTMYMPWVEVVTRLKAIKNDEEYSGVIEKYKTVEVLYIDDFLKTRTGDMPTSADLNISFELLNYRYNNPSFITIISSERQINDILNLDEAIGSRIKERCGNCVIGFDEDIDKNYRLRG